MSADIDLENVTIRFGGFTAVKNVSLKIKGGEFFSILGPSGCGKTTILRTLSGFQTPTSGAVRIGGRDMAGVGPNQRPTALIFQNLALFPLMSVAENIAYGLRVRGIGGAERRMKHFAFESHFTFKTQKRLFAAPSGAERRGETRAGNETGSLSLSSQSIQSLLVSVSFRGPARRGRSGQRDSEFRKQGQDDARHLKIYYI